MLLLADLYGLSIMRGRVSLELRLDRWLHSGELVRKGGIEKWVDWEVCVQGVGNIFLDCETEGHSKASS